MGSSVRASMPQSSSVSEVESVPAGTSKEHISCLCIPSGSPHRFTTVKASYDPVHSTIAH